MPAMQIDKAVDIDFTALEGKGEFTITPFDGLQMRAVKTQTEIS